MLQLALILLLTPLVGFLVQSAFGRRLPRQGDWWTIACIGTSLACSLSIFARSLGGERLDPAIASSGARWDWLRMGDHVWTVGIKIDGLTAVMLVVVTLVAFLVHVFSVGYMKGDPKYGKFFQWLQMFSVSMLMLVLADNVLTLFIGWELVGLCSYKLIGFWSEKRAPGNAARKAFITTRIGDLGMVAAIMLIYRQTGSFSFDAIFRAVETGSLSDQLRTIASLGFFLAAMGKSAQFPLHVWLPDAMEGPTPVSALIHAATMVAAGVYLVGRMYPLFTPASLEVVAVVGTVTALMAGLIAIAQDDIKKVLAYSTVSQLGFMFAALGCGAWHAGLFHLTTHAFFKALMFLGSGSVIAACHHEQDMRKMGGLWKKLPITGTTFFIGVLAIAGFPFITSGFFSKDAILAGAWHSHRTLAWILIASATLTAFYMFRLFAMTFLGKPKDHHVHEHAHESPLTMTLPLVVLAVFSVVAGYDFWHSKLLDPAGASVVVHEAEAHEGGEHAAPGHEGAGATASRLAVAGDHHHEHEGLVVILAILAGVGGLVAGFAVFGSGDPAKVARWKSKPVRALEPVCAAKFGFDELYRELILRPAYHVAQFLAFTDREGVDGAVNGIGRAATSTSVASGATDRVVVDGIVRGTGAAVLLGGDGVARMHGGRLRSYLGMGIALTAVVLLLVAVFAYVPS